MATGKNGNNNNGKKRSGNKPVKNANQALERRINPEEKITRYNLKTERILEFSNLGLWELDVKRNQFKGSKSTYHILGIKCASLIFDFTELKQIITKKEDRENLERKLVKLQKEGVTFDIALRIKNADNEKRSVRMVAGKLDDGQIGGTLSDITELRIIERELIKSKNRAEKADHFKSAFLTNLSHELRTPMNAILGFTELLNQDSLSREQKNEYVHIIKSRANYLLSLIDDINELTKFESGNVEVRKTSFLLYPVFSELYDEFEKIMKGKGKSNISLILNIPDELKNIEIYTDHGRLYQLMSILLSNAIKFTEKGVIEFGYKTSDEYVKFFVNDTGIGMSTEEQKNIFFRFSQIEETTSGKYGKTGFNLTISRHIVELLGGKIKVKSELQNGSHFHFIIPTDSPPKTEKPMITDIEDIKSINWKEKIILVAEDEEVNYKFLEAVLLKTQAQILRAKTGLEAIELCTKIPQIDIVLMDIKMPVMNGYEATAEIKKIRPELPVIAQTAFSTQEEIIKCEESGCVDYITKPIDIRQLLFKIDKYS